MPVPDTYLAITGPGINPWSARGLRQTLEPIAQAASFRRTINGDLRNLAVEQFEKYRSTISCEDVTVPALDGVWPGLILTVDCAAELSYLTAGGSPSRSVVASSSYVDGAYTRYRPQLTMMVLGYSVDLDEYGARVAWQLLLEEV
jgi:hypothetical protein